MSIRAAVLLSVVKTSETEVLKAYICSSLKHVIILFVICPTFFLAVNHIMMLITNICWLVGCDFRFTFPLSG
jgi:hypothetical protein